MINKILSVVFSVLVLTCIVVIPYISKRDTTETENYDVAYQVTTHSMETVQISTSSLNQSEVPGAFDASLGFQIGVTSFGDRSSVSSSSSDDLTELLKSQATTPFHLSLNKTLTDVTYSQDGSQMTYHQSLSYAFENPSQELEVIQTINYPMFSLQYQMEYKPEFLYSWQTMAQISSKMYDQSFQQFYYAQNVYQAYFWNETQVKGNVLSSLNEAEQNTVYSDPVYGMNSTAGLSAWIAASLQEQGLPYGWIDPPQDVLTSYFAAKFVPLSKSFFTEVCGTSSIISIQTAVLESLLIQENYFAGTSEINATSLAARQWAQGDILNNEHLTLANSTTFVKQASMQDMGMNFMKAPELSAQLCSDSFIMSQGMELLNQNDVSSNTRTLLNPMNIKWMLDAIPDPAITITQIQERFGLNSLSQADCLWNYITQQGLAYKDGQSIGSGFSRMIELAMPILEENTAFQLASRTMAAYNYDNTLGCVDYFKVITNDTAAAAVCDGVNFKNLTTFQYYVAASWYNQDNCNTTYRDDWVSTTGLNASFYDAFYDTTGSDANRFGSVLRQINELNFGHFKCLTNIDSVANCSSLELAQRQWGGSEITYNPSIWNLGFTIPSISIAEWGDWGLPGVSQAPEYFFYSQYYPETGTNLTYDQVVKIIDDGYNWFGLKNSFNAKQLVQNYGEMRSNTSMVAPEYFMAASAHFGLTEDQMSAMIEVMLMYGVDYLYGGYTDREAVDLLVFGWESDLATRVSPYTTANFLRGDAMWFDPNVTPVLPTHSFQTSQKITVYTGTDNGTDGETGQVIAMNGLGYPNKPIKVWNGEVLVDTYLRCFHDFDMQKVFDGSYNANNSNAETAYVLDASSLQYMGLDFLGNSKICAAGYDDACKDEQWSSPTIVKGTTSTAFSKAASCAYNLPLSGQWAPSVNLDNDSGFALEQHTQQDTYLDEAMLFTPSVNPFGALKKAMVGADMNISMNQVEQKYNVSTEVFVSVAYPVNGTETHFRHETRQVDSTEPRIAWIVCLSILCVGFFCAATWFLMKACKKDEVEQEDIEQGGDQVKLLGIAGTVGTTGSMEDKTST